jgi:predicted glutamine amidotransferase
MKPQALLARFAEMAQKSKALDGDWQGDGYGVAWLDEQNKWQVKKSLSPIWEEIQNLDNLPETGMFLAHARSASFPQHKGVIEFNQPYILGEYAFVFNGLLKGVSLPNIPGKIGAEKIWSLLQKELESNDPQEALERTRQLLINSAQEIVALNVGLATKENMYFLNHFTKHPEYYSLHEWSEDETRIICSEPL